MENLGGNAEDLEDMFEDYANEDQAEPENPENNTANETPGAVKIAAPKRAVKNPRLKFNADRLIGERGIPVLIDHFKDVKFKGPGHEVEDLDKLLTKLEHWTHRLFPSMKFEDCLQHIEKLGKKRPVQTCLRRIRLDQPIRDDDFVKEDENDGVRRNEEEDYDDVRRNEDFEPEEMSAFDRLLGDRDETSSIDAPTSDDVSNSNSFYASPLPNNNVGHVLGSSFGSSLNEEQRERMERNRMLAAERRKARLAAMEQSTVRSEPENHETFSENLHNGQNSFDKLLFSAENNEERNKSDLETAHEVDENLRKSSDLNHDNSEKLGLDDLMDLVDEEDPVSDENAIMSSSEKVKSGSHNVNYLNTFPPEDADSISKNTKNGILLPSGKSQVDNLDMESSLDLICEKSADSDISAKPDCSAMEQSTVRPESEKHEAFSDNVLSVQNSFNKVHYSSENNEKRNKSDLETAHEVNECLKKSPDVNRDNSEKLALDDLMDLVGEEDPVSDQNAIMSSSEKVKSGSDNVNYQNTFPPEDENFDSVSKNTKNGILLPSEKSPEENLDMESSLDLICEKSADSDISGKPDCSAIEQNTVRSESEKHETFSGNILNIQNSINKVLYSSESNEGRDKSDLETAHEVNECLKKSPDVNQDNSEKLGLDDLVDEEDPVSDGNAVVPSPGNAESISGNANCINTFPPEDANNLKNFDSVSKNTKNEILSTSEKSPEENITTDSSWNLIFESSESSDIGAKPNCSAKNILIDNEQVIKESGDLNLMDCDNRDF